MIEDIEHYPTYRASYLEQAITSAVVGYDTDEGVVDWLDEVLADARHLADLRDLDFAELCKRSYGIYLRDRTEP